MNASVWEWVCRKEAVRDLASTVVVWILDSSEVGGVGFNGWVSKSDDSDVWLSATVLNGCVNNCFSVRVKVL